MGHTLVSKPESIARQAGERMRPNPKQLQSEEHTGEEHSRSRTSSRAVITFSMYAL